MNATPKTHAQQIRSANARKSAVVRDVRRLAFTSETGVVRTVKPHEHVMEVEGSSDLAGGVSVGWCHCGEYMRHEGL